MSSYHVAVDVGGTFTDVVLQNTDDGTLLTAKVPTAADPAQGFLSGVERVLADAGVDPGAVHRVFHGTTIATNAVIQRTPAKIGLITTKGFKYVLEIGRHSVPRTRNMYGWIKPERPVTPDLIFEVEERVDHTGNLVTPLKLDNLEEIVRQLRESEVEAVAVCLLYSYANPEHERVIGSALAQAMPGIYLSLSSDVLPQFREFERSVAATVNAFLMPRVSQGGGTRSVAGQSPGFLRCIANGRSRLPGVGAAHAEEVGHYGRRRHARGDGHSAPSDGGHPERE